MRGGIQQGSAAWLRHGSQGGHHPPVWGVKATTQQHARCISSSFP